MISAATGRMARILGVVFHAKGATAVTSREAGRALAATRHRNDRDYYRATAIALAEKIGRPDLAEPLR